MRHTPILITLIFFAITACSSTDEPDQVTCLADDSDVAVLETADGIQFVQTPDERFNGLEGYAFAPNYAPVDGLRMHYVDAGPSDGETILLLHGEPSWSYLYRTTINALASAGYRVVAPDLIGMGRSDKPIDIGVHTYAQHIAWVKQFIDQLDLQQITLVAHDWGGLIGLRVLGDSPDRFVRAVALNTALPVIDPGANPYVMPESTEVDCDLGDFAPSDFQTWIEYALRAPDLRPSQIVQTGTSSELTPLQLAAYDAPYPSFIYKAAIRAFPSMITAVSNENAAAWNALGSFDRPFLTLWGELDPNLGTEDRQNALVNHVPGASDEYHERFAAGHFLQEDLGTTLAATISFFLTTHPIGAPDCWEPTPDPNGMDCQAICDYVLECNPSHPRGICMQSCQVVAPYLTVQASDAVSPCMLSKECSSFGTFGEALDGCMAPLIFGGQITPAPGNEAACETVTPVVEACDPGTNFGTVCTGLAAVFTSESMTKIADCATASCGDELRNCLRASNCTFVYDDVGAIPD